MGKDKIVGLISKLKKLSENNSNVEEASSAAARMQELIEKYNIAEAELDFSDQDTPEDFTNEEFYQEKGKNIIRWKLSLASTLARLNNCKMVFQRGRKIYPTGKTINGKTIIYGRPSKVAIVRYMFQYLVREIERLCKEAVRDGYGRGKSYTNAFKVGAVEVIALRLHAMQNEIRQDCSEKALVKFDQDKNALLNYIRQFRFRREDMSSNVSSRRGLNDGRIAGNSINLNTGKEMGPGCKALRG